MAEQSELQLALSLETDNSIAQAAKELDKVADSADSLTSALKKIEREKALDKLAQDASDAAKAGAKTETVIESLNAELKKVGANDKEIEKVIRQFEKLRNTVDDVDTKRVSQLDFADRSGDKASIAGSSRGALDALTGGNAGPLSSALEGAEAIFDLGEAAGKIGGPVGKAVTSLGPAGLAGAAGVAGIALAAGTIALGIYAQKAEQARQVQSAFTDSLTETIALLNSNEGTSQAVADRRSEIEQEIQNANETVAALKQVREARNEENSALEDVFTASRVLAGGTRKQLNEDITAAEQSVAQAEASLEAFNLTLNESEIAANDAAQAERELAAERTQSILTEAAQAGELEATRQRFADSTREQIALEEKNTQNRIKTAQTELASLQANNDGSEEAAARIVQLTETISFLGEQSALLNSLRSGAKTDEQVAREKALQSARTETARATDKAYQSELAKAKGEQETATRNRTSERASTPRRTATARSSAPSTKDTGSDGIIENLRRIENDIIKVQNEAEKQRIDQVINNNQRLQDIARDFGDTRADALEEGNFLSLEAANKEEQRAKRNQQIENKRANENIKRDSKRSLDELSNEQSKYENQRLQMTQQANQRMISLHGQFLQAQVNQISAAFRAISGYTAGRSVSESQARQRGLISNAASRPATP